jgi:hypothetical protein
MPAWSDIVVSLSLTLFPSGFTNCFHNSGTDFGTFPVGGFSRFVGMFSGISSATIRYQMGVHSGDYQVTSSFVVNSGPQVIDVLNYGIYAKFDVTAAVSMGPDFLVVGESVR